MQKGQDGAGRPLCLESALIPNDHTLHTRDDGVVSTQISTLLSEIIEVV